MDGDVKNPATSSTTQEYANQCFEDNDDTIGDKEINIKNNFDVEREEKNENFVGDRCSMQINVIQALIRKRYKENYRFIRNFIYIALLILYFGYFAYAMYFRFGDEAAITLLVCTLLGMLFGSINVARRMRGEEIQLWLQRLNTMSTSTRGKRWMKIIDWALKITVTIFLLVYIIVDIAIEYPENLISMAGMFVFIFLFYVTSTNPAKVNWHPVFWGITLQYLFALLILRTNWGYQSFKFMGDRLTEYFDYANVGAIFSFGDNYEDHLFAFKIMPLFVFIFMTISILNYIGLIPFLINFIGRFLAFCMRTTPAESLCAAANIFMGLVDAPLIVKEFLPDMTKSELHTVMSGGFATIAGTVLGVYISFGISASHLLSASVMSAPAALALSKLSCPETQLSKKRNSLVHIYPKPTEHNIFEAASSGATSSIKVIAAVMVNVMAFLSLLAFVNATLTWFGDRVGIKELTLEFICSYMLYPIAYLMGTDRRDCFKVAELIGIKTFTNDFIAYSRLSTLITNREVFDNYTSIFNNTDSWSIEDGSIVLREWANKTLVGGFMTTKSEVIATYALCGFTNFGAVGITLGALGILAPTRKKDLSRLVFRSMLVGNAACFLTACVAGLLNKHI